MLHNIYIDNAVTGFLIGLIASIPVGPIALMCLQRSLQKGHWHGFSSGLGAAFSDSVYDLIALFGLSFVIDFVNAHTLLIQAVGMMVILGYGIYIFFKNPAAHLQKPKDSGSNYFQDFISAFLLCLSNPMMIFVFLGIFAQFTFLSNDAPWYQILLGVVSVFAGSASWWFSITLLASIFHDKVNIRGLWIINKVTGGLIFLIALVGFVMTLCGKTMV